MKAVFIRERQENCFSGTRVSGSDKFNSFLTAAGTTVSAVFLQQGGFF